MKQQNMVVGPSSRALSHGLVQNLPLDDQLNHTCMEWNRSMTRSFLHTLLRDDFLSLPSAKEVGPYLTLCRVPCLMTAVAPEEQLLCGQKRRRSAIEEEHSIPATPQLPWKKAKSRYQSRRETNTAYWDSLSKLRLTRRALNELNRRNRKRASPIRPTIAHGLDPSDEAGHLKNLSQQLKRFARHGGPDLRDVGGVSLTRDIL